MEAPERIILDSQKWWNKSPSLDHLHRLHFLSRHCPSHVLRKHFLLPGTPPRQIEPSSTPPPPFMQTLLCPLAASHLWQSRNDTLTYENCYVPGSRCTSTRDREAFSRITAVHVIAVFLSFSDSSTYNFRALISVSVRCRGGSTADGDYRRSGSITLDVLCF